MPIRLYILSGFLQEGHPQSSKSWMTILVCDITRDIFRIESHLPY